jgi:hypothetical protein
VGKGRGAYRGNLREGDYWEDMVGEGRIMLKWGSVDCIDLAQDMEKWRGISCLGEELLASQKGLCCMELVIKKSSGLT